MSRIGYIYTLRHPVTGEIRYVGMSVDPERRLREHIKRVKNGERALHCARWIGKLLDQGLEPAMDVVCSAEYGEPLQNLEKKWIADLREQGLRLTNITDGGEGFSGKKSAEHRRKIGLAHKGKTLPQEVLDKISATRLAKGIRASVETKALFSEQRTGDKNGRARMSELEARAILALQEYGLSAKTLSEAFNLNRQTVAGFLCRGSWPHLETPKPFLHGELLLEFQLSEYNRTKVAGASFPASTRDNARTLVHRLLQRGMPVKEIVSELGLSPATVRRMAGVVRDNG